MLAPPGRFLLVCGALLMVANVALGEGIYQRTRDGKTFVWNNHPKPGDEATWSGSRDREGYARGFGTLIWYTAKQGSETRSAKPALYARFWGHMVRGKLNGPVNVHSKRKTTYAIFTDGVRTTRWVAGPAPSRAGAQWRAIIVQRSQGRDERPGISPEIRKAEKAEPSEPLTVQAENSESSREEAARRFHEQAAQLRKALRAGSPMAEREPAAPGEGTVVPRSGEENLQRSTSNVQRPMAEIEPVAPGEGPLAKRAENAERSEPDGHITSNSERFREQAAPRPMGEAQLEAPEEAPRRAQAADVDDSLLLLAWPPPILEKRFMSKGSLAGASMRGRARLSQEQVVDLADAAARSRGYDPTEYQRQDLQYDPSDHAWLLVYDARSPDETGERAKHLSVAVGDKTKRTAIVIRKKAETVDDSD